jgi:hypothetical protein
MWHIYERGNFTMKNHKCIVSAALFSTLIQLSIFGISYAQYNPTPTPTLSNGNNIPGSNSYGSPTGKCECHCKAGAGTINLCYDNRDLADCSDITFDITSSVSPLECLQIDQITNRALTCEGYRVKDDKENGRIGDCRYIYTNK